MAITGEELDDVQRRDGFGRRRRRPSVLLLSLDEAEGEGACRAAAARSRVKRAWFSGQMRQVAQQGLQGLKATIRHC